MGNVFDIFAEEQFSAYGQELSEAVHSHAQHEVMSETCLSDEPYTHFVSFHPHTQHEVMSETRLSDESYTHFVSFINIQRKEPDSCD